MNDAPGVGRKTVLVLASTYPRHAGDHEPGFVHELSRRLLPWFDVVAVVPCAPGASTREVLDGVEVFRYRYAPRRFETLVNDGGIGTNLKLHPWKWLLVPTFVLGQLLAVRRLARRQRIDIIHAHWLIPQGLVAALANLAWGIPFAVTSHGADVYSFRGALLQRLKCWIAGRAVRLSVVGSAMRGELGRSGIAEERIWVRSMGVDLAGRFSPGGGTRTTAEIIFVGRLVEKKGLRFLIDAMPLVLESCPSAVLTVAGFGPEAEPLQARVRSLGLTDKVHFLGAIPPAEVPALLRRGAVTVAPFVEAASGDQEGMPLALLEAVGCGCPVVAGDVAGVRDVLGLPDGRIVVNPQDCEALAAAIVEKLSNPVSARTEAESLRARVAGYFDWSAVAGDYAGWLGAAAVTTQGTAPDSRLDARSSSGSRG